MEKAVKETFNFAKDSFISAYTRNYHVSIPATFVAIKYKREATRFATRFLTKQLATTMTYKQQTFRNLMHGLRSMNRPIDMARTNRILMRRILPVAAAYVAYKGIKNMRDNMIVTDYGLQ